MVSFSRVEHLYMHNTFNLYKKIVYNCYTILKRFTKKKSLKILETCKYNFILNTMLSLPITFKYIQTPLKAIYLSIYLYL